MIVGSQADAYYRALECGAKTEAEKLGVDLTLDGPKSFDTSQQVPIVNGAVAKKPDAILIAPTGATALFAPLKAASAQGTKIVTVDTELADTSIVSSAVVADFEKEGAMGADSLNELLGGHGKILAIFSPPGVTTSDLGRKGFEAKIKDYPELEVASVQFSNGDPGKSASIVSAAFARYPDLSAVYVFNGGDLEGVVTAVKEAHKSGDVKVLSNDAQPFQVDLLREGAVSELILPKPYDIGVAAVQQAVNALNDEPVEKRVVTDITLATPQTMDDPDVSKYFFNAC
ncbi:ribose ABC transporter substrate-binding protein [Mycolicibacterium murale]|uniref:Ribose ABC transporter substrate-binding protein n=1 Tax=Mycolicibacterium murale TaxID=182220 RepID=A0A7I9WG49_9MYCO|nr:substrate-binding domain-containing protein [Mycolicibacterium murale]GFG56721.1 ribose ABC transporter substrate-binding protein [Mycolicibacterium murale]